MKHTFTHPSYTTISPYLTQLLSLFFNLAPKLALTRHSHLMGNMTHICVSYVWKHIYVYHIRTQKSYTWNHMCAHMIIYGTYMIFELNTYMCSHIRAYFITFNVGIWLLKKSYMCTHICAIIYGNMYSHIWLHTYDCTYMIAHIWLHIWLYIYYCEYAVWRMVAHIWLRIWLSWYLLVYTYVPNMNVLLVLIICTHSYWIKWYKRMDSDTPWGMSTSYIS